MIKIILISLAVFLSACASVPRGIEPISDFQINRFTGKWFEIARLDNPFERGLSNITAEYSLRDDGSVKVVNRGYKIKNQEWKLAEGKAEFVGPMNKGQLKVSFLGPFYAAYNIIELDKKDYQYVMVAGGDRSYLWILSRTKNLSEKTQKMLVEKAKSLSFDTDKLIYVSHSPIKDK